MSEKYTVLNAKLGDIPCYTFTMKVRDLLSIYYVAVRGVDKTEGSVQRVLNKGRISKIKDYILEGNTFFNSFIINWTDDNYLPTISDKEIEIELVHSSAQVIDGQHRLAGFEEAVAKDESIGDRDIIVTLCVGLSTKQAAEIFLNINTEQKPVPKSLMFDLFGEVVDDESHSVNRATDIARILNDEMHSPLYKCLKFPGSPRGVGQIELSTFVTSLKEPLKRGGAFSLYKLTSYDFQKSVVGNFFQAIKEYYVEANIWHIKSKNPFLKASGFNGAIEFLVSTLIQRCAEKSSFSVATMKKVIDFDIDDLLTLEELKGLDGKTSKKRVREALEKNLLKSLPENDAYEF
jgi:DGQHR domain-containing protein